MDAALKALAEQVSSVSPAEILVQKRDLETLRGLLANVFAGLYSTLDDWIYTEDYARELITGQLKTQSLKGFGLEDRRLAVMAAGAAMHYLQETQKSKLLHIRRITPYDVGDHIVLDPSTKRNLEISSSSTGSSDGTLFGVLDRTHTPMGGRLLKQWVNNPLNSVEAIRRRLDAVEEFVRSVPLLEGVAPILGRIGDLERLNTRVCTARATPREMIALKSALQSVADARDAILGASPPPLAEVRDYHLTTSSPIGNIAYVETGSWHLDSMVPVVNGA